MAGSNRCRSHGGHVDAYRNMPPGAVSLVTGKATTRDALAKLSVRESFPSGVAWLASPVERGKAIEHERNKRLGLTE